MARTHEEFLALNDPVGSGTGSSPSGTSSTLTDAQRRMIAVNVGRGAPGGIESELLGQQIATFEREMERQRSLGLFGDAGRGGGGGGATSAAQRAITMKRLDIERKKLEFQKQTGLRDIGQAREKGLEAAINNALQRGIFRSGIREKNVAEVERESGEAKSDLAADIQFALDDLKLRRESAALVGTGGGGGGGGGATVDEATASDNAADFAIKTAEVSLVPGFDEFGQPTSPGGVVPLTPQPTDRPGSPR